MVQLQIDKNDENQRLDKFMLKYLNKAPKSFVYKMIRKKNIKLNNKKCIGNEILQANDIINIYLAEDTINKFKQENSLKSTFKNFEIIYEDENLIICYKPINLVSQPDFFNKNNSLNDQLIFYLYKKGEYKKDDNFTPSICNRLDKNTSGIVIFGKNFKTTKDLNEMFKNKTIDKYYLTAVEGILKEKGTLKLYHKKDKNNTAIISQKKQDDFKEIITEYTPLAYKDNKTLLNIKLITGKSHQIRASFKYIGFPILGDQKYGIKDLGLNNQFLHCYKVVFKENNNSLNYLFNKSFVCKYMDKSFKNVLKFFEYNI